MILVNNINRNEDEEAVCVKGTRGVFCIQGLSNGRVSVRNLTCFCTGCMNKVGHCENKQYVKDFQVKKVGASGQKKKQREEVNRTVTSIPDQRT